MIQLKTVFFGSSDYCLPILDALKTHFTLVGVVTKKGQSVEKYSLSHNIRTYTPNDKQKLLSLKAELSQLKPDFAVVADYGMIIPKEIFGIPLHKTLNIHFSKLPKFRGPSPVQYTILTGERNASISVIIMDENLDTGDIVWQKDVELTGNETTGSLYIKLFNIIAFDLPDLINKYVQNELKPQKQDNSLTTFTKHLTRQDGYISPQDLAAALNRGIKSSSIDRAIRAFTPWPGAWTNIQITNNLPAQAGKQQLTKRLKIIKAHLEPPASQGRPLQGYRLVLDLVQLEGKKPVTWKQFMAGYPNISF